MAGQTFIPQWTRKLAPVLAKLVIFLLVIVSLAFAINPEGFTPLFLDGNIALGIGGCCFHDLSVQNAATEFTGLSGNRTLIVGIGSLQFNITNQGPNQPNYYGKFGNFTVPLFGQVPFEVSSAHSVCGNVGVRPVSLLPGGYWKTNASAINGGLTIPLLANCYIFFNGPTSLVPSWIGDREFRLTFNSLPCGGESPFCGRSILETSDFGVGFPNENYRVMNPTIVPQYFFPSSFAPGQPRYFAASWNTTGILYLDFTVVSVAWSDTALIWEIIAGAFLGAYLPKFVIDETKRLRNYMAKKLLPPKAPLHNDDRCDYSPYSFE